MSFFRITTAWIALALALSHVAAAFDDVPTEQSFQNPPAAARPWVYWWWLNSNVTREGITRDLEEMNRQGIQGVLIFNAGGGDSPSGPKFLSPEWNALFKFALSEASRLGMEASISLCDGWDAGGPWIPAEAANKKLTYSETLVDGPKAMSQALPLPPTLDGFYRDVAVLAYKEKGPRPVQPAEIRACPTIGGYCDEKNWPPADTADGDPNTVWRSAHAPAPGAPAWIDFVYSEPLAASAIFLVGAKDAGPQQCALQTSDDGVNFTTLPVTWTMAKGESKRVEFPEVKAKIYRLVIQSSHTPDVQLAEMWLLRKGDEPAVRPGIKWWQFKSGNRGFWDWPKKGPAVMEEEYPEDGAADCQSKEVIDLTSKMDKDGKLSWQAPEGRWTILRFGYTLVGQRTRCSSGGSANVIGYEADMLDPLGIETHFKHCGEPLLAAAGEYAGKTLKYLHIDSYEIGADIQGQQPTWSAKFLEEFRTHRGYDPLPYLPTMARRIVDNREKTDRFLWDIRMTISDLMCERFFKRFGELAHEHGVGMHCETGYGTYPHPQFDGLRAAGQCDVTMGEFWYGTDIMSQFYPFCNVIRSVASPAHIYGKKIVQAESFTAWSHFLEYPSALKPLGDEAFCDGLNRIVFHQWTHQPNDDMPGNQYGAGTHIDRHLTWWNMSQPFLTYLTRCQYILQSGRFHADVCYLNAEGSSHYVPSKKYLDPPLPPGYNFDCINAEIILNHMTVDKHGYLVLPSGMSYALMVLPTQRTMSPAVLRKIRQFIAAGASVVGEKPLRAPSLTNWPECDKELKTIADSMWGENPAKEHVQVIGEGQLGWGGLPRDALEGLLNGENTPQDFEATNENNGFDFIHRIIDGADFYFVSNQSNQAKKGGFLFRVRDRMPELWDPATGLRRNLVGWSVTDDDRTRIPMTFEPYQSFFVVFRASAHERTGDDRRSDFPRLQQVAEITGPWTVSFDPKWGGPENVVFEKLEDWTKRPEEGIKYYSGTAVYKKSFDLDGAAIADKDKKPLYLDLGTVNYLARVRLNGKDLGVVWTAPWRVDISGAVKAKGNELEIEVVNTWLNRLVGDANSPAEKRLAKTNIHYPPNQPLMPSGLLGPVTVQKQSSDSTALNIVLPKEVRPLPEPLSADQTKPGFAIRGIKGWFWTPEQYLEEISILAKYKMNFLMNCYGSMFSSGPPHAWVNEWWKPLPQDKKEAYAKVIRACKENGIEFCFAVHSQLASPRPLKPTSAEDIDQYYQNYAWAQSQGVSWFAVFLDDVNWGDKGPAIGGAEHAKMVNTIFSRLRANDPKAQMIFCPVPYWGDGTQPDHREYLEALGKDLHKDAYVIWTGDNVVSPKITRKAAESYRSIVKHRLFLFDNYPVNDNNPTMHLGPVVGRDADLCEAVSAYMSNPMCPQNQINRIPLLTCADYAYNPKMYDPNRSIGQAIAHLAENDAQRNVLKDLAEAYPGMIRLGSQSTALNPMFDRFKELVAQGKTAEAGEYLHRMEDLAARMDAAFPNRFADAKKTLRGNLEEMQTALNKSK